MITEELRHRRDELEKRRQPFVTATVVQVQRPTSAERGDVALVTADGSLEGFVGGACARHSVLLYSLKALERGEPLLLRIMPDPDEHDPESIPMGDGQEIASDEGSITVRNPCLSGGAIEVFLEPTVPAPRVLVTGESPIAGSLARIGPAVGFEMIPTGRSGAPERVLPVRGDLALIVASHGRDELEPLRAAIEAEIPYIGLVASLKRGAAVLADLEGMGLDPAAVHRIDSRAGIDIGAATASEIALSILASVIAVRRGAERSPRGAGGGDVPPPVGPRAFLGAGPAGPAPAANLPALEGNVPASAPAIQTAVDPICGMTVVVDTDTPSATRDGERFYFCCDGCQRTFMQQAA